MGTGSLYKMIRGLRDTSLQNATKFYQCPSAAANLLVESTLEMSSTSDKKLSRKLVHLAGSKFSMAVSVDRLFPYDRVVRRW